MAVWDTVAILGVGLIGGSIGKALQFRKLARSVVGVGRRPERLAMAQRAGAITRGTLSIAEGVAEADLVVVCTPVERIVEQVTLAAQHCPAEAWLTDAGSTKAPIVEGVAARLGAKARFVGSHPLAGSEKTGAEFSRADLFEGRLAVITPTPETPADVVTAAGNFWQSLGCTVLRKTAQQHDQSVATTSHAAHLVAAALSASLPPDQGQLAASGWLDTTRIAAGDPQLWRQILLQNRHHVLKSLDKFEKVLTSFREALDQSDREAIVRLLELGKRNRDALGS